jgi:C-terminal processing protease CtpA/Prc
LVLLLHYDVSISQESQTQNFFTDKYVQAGLVWGFLKYHHPEVSKGKFNWDSSGVYLMDQVEKINNQQELDIILLKFIKQFPYKNEKIIEDKKNYFNKNEDYSWIKNEGFAAEIKFILNEIRNNTKPNDFYAKINFMSRQLDFKNENGFVGFDSQIKSHRLLFLFNFWNAINYWDVNKYLFDENWLSFLPQAVNHFNNCNSKLDFEIAKSRLISSINDSHSFYFSKEITDKLFNFKPPFFVKNINDSLFVQYIPNKYLAEKEGIEIGDVIFKINDENIRTSIERLKPLISSSNPNFLKRWSNFLLWSANDSLKVAVLKKNGTIINKKIQLYEKVKDSLADGISSYPTEKYKRINPSVGYINLGFISKSELKKAFDLFNGTKGLIIDLRNYPKSINEQDIAAYLYPKRKEFIKILFPLKNKPSLCEYDGKGTIDFIKDPFLAGGANEDYYKGKVILLVDSKTQSNAEYIGMAIQGAPNCITIGEQTAGSAMNVVEYTMSDATKIYFTGLGAFYPDGTEVQRNGLKIDIQVKLSAKNIDFDAYIKKATNLIEN